MSTTLSCAGLHVAAARPDHRRLGWASPYPAGDRVRVRASTCYCGETMYELCFAGGQAFIRRTRQRGDDQVGLHETRRWPAAEAGELWEALIAGDAR
jgi:hypothetical protein